MRAVDDSLRNEGSGDEVLIRRTRGVRALKLEAPSEIQKWKLKNTKMNPDVVQFTDSKVASLIDLADLESLPELLVLEEQAPSYLQ